MNGKERQREQKHQFIRMFTNTLGRDILSFLVTFDEATKTSIECSSDNMLYPLYHTRNNQESQAITNF